MDNEDFLKVLANAIPILNMIKKKSIYIIILQFERCTQCANVFVLL